MALPTGAILGADVTAMLSLSEIDMFPSSCSISDISQGLPYKFTGWGRGEYALTMLTGLSYKGDMEYPPPTGFPGWS